MWICHCKGVTDGQIRSAILGGARTPVEIGARCRAGTGCGGCVPAVCRLLDTAHAMAPQDSAAVERRRRVLALRQRDQDQFRDRYRAQYEKIHATAGTDASAGV